MCHCSSWFAASRVLDVEVANINGARSDSSRFKLTHVQIPLVGVKTLDHIDDVLSCRVGLSVLGA